MTIDDQFDMAMKLMSGGPTQEDEAIRLFTSAAHAGHSGSQAMLGSLLRARGKLSEAAEWLRKAGDGGEIDAYVELGSIYSQGKDYLKASYCLRAAGCAGHGVALANLGFLHTNGLGVKLSWSKAIFLYLTAQTFGNSEAGTILSEIVASNPQLARTSMLKVEPCFKELTARIGSDLADRATRGLWVIDTLDSIDRDLLHQDDPTAMAVCAVSGCRTAKTGLILCLNFLRASMTWLAGVSRDALNAIPKHENARETPCKASNSGRIGNHAPLKVKTQDKKTGKEAIYMQYDASSPHFAAGMRLQSQGRFKEAFACFEAWTQKDPDNPLSWNCKGLSLRGLCQFDDAMVCFEQALRLRPNDAPTFGNMGRTLHDKGDYEAALVVLDKNLEAFPSSADSWNFKGSCLLKLQRPQEALVCYDRATTFEPAKADYWSNKGTAYADLDQYGEALSCYKKAVDVEPGCFGAWYNMADIEERLGNGDGAIRSLESFISLAPATMNAQIANAQRRIQRLKQM